MGMAQKLFLEKKRECKTALHEVHFLTYLRNTYSLNAIDFTLAKSLLKKFPKNEAVLILLCHLSLAARNGHLLLKCENGEILPSVKSLWLKEAEILSEDLKKLEKLVLEGFKEIMENPVFEELFSKEEKQFFSGYLCKTKNRLYFQRYFVLEQSVIKRLKILMNQEPALKINSDKIRLKAFDLEEQGKLLKSQAASLLTAAVKSVMILSGGPGTGKTYTAGFLIEALLEATGENGMKIAAAAPTGKAAANLQRSLSRFLKGSFKAKTLHSLLGIKENRKKMEASEKMIDADLILVDEASMIDISLMDKLLTAIRPGSRLILLGDPYQLPSVEAGSVFADFIALLPENSAHLSKCMRAELQEIVDFAKAINEGESNKALNMLKSGRAVSLAKEEFSQESILEHVSLHFPLFFNPSSSPDEILDAFNQFRMLSPIRKGLFGVDALNAYFFERLVLPHLEKKSVMLPIMLQQNSSKLDLFNGETGVLVLHPARTAGLKQGDFALFPDKEKGFRKIPALLLPRYEYAYCLSVHKAQGSEFGHVLCILADGAEYFGRKVLYTAVTRAKKKLEIFGSVKTIEKTILEKGERLSGLATQWK
ncbi:MAG TPA: exodeoxyribonuclease V subunit alpha [Parachlamydiaceae bacterium]|nr:exodeoxyribonuclease V subunit alpha [Parachlamydiaceae bacterium]